MGKWCVGPHDQQGWPAGVDWARHANVVKSVGNPAAVMAAPDHALRLYRWPFSPAQQDDMVRRGDYPAYGQAMLNGLAGYAHPNLWLEGPNEPGPVTPELVAFYVGLKRWLSARGHNCTGPCSATGAYTAEDVERLRGLDLGLWTFHAYWTRKYGPTVDNAWRWRRFWRPGDPPVVVGECGFDQCRDGPGGTLEPPAGTENCGYQAQGVSTEEMAASLTAYSDSLTNAYELGAVAYTTSPNDEWKRRGFDLDPVAPLMAAQYQPWAPEVPPPSRTPMMNVVDVSNHQRVIDWDAVARHRFPDGSRVEGAIIKFSEDDYGADDFYDTFAARNWTEAHRVGLARKCYHFAQPDKSSPAESVTVLQTALARVGGLGPRDGVCLDIEAGTGTLHVWVAEWVGLCRQVFGMRPVFYSGLWFMAPHDLLHEDLAPNPLWYASYQPQSPPVPPPWKRIDIWQYTANGTVQGISGPVDLNYFQGTREEFELLGNEPGIVVPPPTDDWEGRVFVPINDGAQAVFGLSSATDEDRDDATLIIQAMDRMKVRHP